MRQHAFDLGLAAEAGDRAHRAMQVGGVGHPAARLAFVEAAVIDELDVEPAERRGGLEHLALDAAGAVPSRLAARRCIEREDQPAAAAAGPHRRGALQIAQEGVDLGGARFCRKLVLVAAHAGLSQTEVSWKTAPPPGRPGSALVSRLMPMPSSKAWFGHSPSTITTRFCMPSKARACTVMLPWLLPIRTRSPSAMPSAVSASGWTIAVGRPSRARLDGVLLKLVFRKERDGAGIRRNGRCGSPSSITATWSGKASRLACSWPKAAQSAWKWKFLS